VLMPVDMVALVLVGDERQIIDRPSTVQLRQLLRDLLDDRRALAM
jgi:hypothetical protein